MIKSLIYTKIFNIISFYINRIKYIFIEKLLNEVILIYNKNLVNIKNI